MSLDAMGTFALVLVTFIGINLTALRAILERHQQALSRDNARWSEIERAFFELRISLPIEYVRREDWIRFSGTLDAKLDGMREEIREEIGTIKEKLYV